MLVLGGLTLEEFGHCTKLDLRGRRVNPTYRWVTQRQPGCPALSGVACALASGVTSSSLVPFPKRRWSCGRFLNLVILLGGGSLGPAAHSVELVGSGATRVR